MGIPRINKHVFEFQQPYILSLNSNIDLTMFFFSQPPQSEQYVHMAVPNIFWAGEKTMDL